MHYFLFFFERSNSRFARSKSLLARSKSRSARSKSFFALLASALALFLDLDPEMANFNSSPKASILL